MGRSARDCGSSAHGQAGTRGRYRGRTNDSRLGWSALASDRPRRAGGTPAHSTGPTLWLRSGSGRPEFSHTLKGFHGEARTDRLNHAKPARAIDAGTVRIERYARIKTAEGSRPPSAFPVGAQGNPKPGRRPQRDTQPGQRSRSARTGHTPSAPQQTRGSRGGDDHGRRAQTAG